jgi:hypothetical protein
VLEPLSVGRRALVTPHTAPGARARRRGGCVRG